MNNKCVNIAISGLGLLTIEDIKKKLIHQLPKSVDVNWTNLTDTLLDGLIVNEDFFDNNYIQKIIHEKNIPYLKVTKLEKPNDPNSLCTPIRDETPLNHLIQSCLNTEEAPSIQPLEQPSKTSLDFQFFSHMYSEYSRKLLLKDYHGHVAMIDHHAHLAWPDTLRNSLIVDQTIRYVDATTSDLVKISRKNQKNLENWLFEMIWNSPEFIHMPDESAIFKLNYWPQPTAFDQKIILQLSAAFILGAQISKVAEQLNISPNIVKKFIVANQAILNIEKITAKDALFASKSHKIEDKKDSQNVQSFFQKLKRRFGF